jgi:hypothetical protein
MVTCPTKRRIADLDVERNAADRGQDKRGALMVHPPGSPRSGRAGLALQQELDDLGFICLEHVFSLQVGSAVLIRER